MPHLAASDHYALALPAGHRFPIAKYALLKEQLLWQGIAALTLDNNAPLAARDPMGLQACLSMQIADEFGAGVGPMTQRQASIFTMGLTHRYSSPREAVSGVYA